MDRGQSLSGLVTTYREAGTNAVHVSPHKPLIHFSSCNRELWQARLHSPSAPPPPAPDNNLVIGSIFLLFAGGAKASAALGGFDSADIFQVSGCWRRSERKEEGG